MSDELLKGLNNEQREAVSATEGPVLILAGPGAGKTKTLAHRIAYLIRIGVSPSAILAVTFTNKAAQEMRERITQLVTRSNLAIGGLCIGTFHSFALSVLREHATKLGFERRFSIFDEEDAIGLIKEILQEQKLGPKEFPPGLARRAISKLKNELVTPEHFAETIRDAEETKHSFPRILHGVYEKYQKRLHEANAMDFDDLLMQTVSLFKKSPALLEAYQERFRYLNVDEYQDTNHAQYILIKLLASKYRNIAVVGDDAQAIYSFRGADLQNILTFEKDWPDARVIILSRNYRSTQTILDAATGLIKKNIAKKEKILTTERGKGGLLTIATLENEHAEAAYILDTIASLILDGYSPQDIAVLYRTNAQSRAIEEALVKRGLPYTLIGGTRFYERKEIKDLVAYLRLIQNPQDFIALKRAINTPPRGIGKQTFLAYIAGPNGNRASRNRSRMTQAKEALARFDALLEHLNAEALEHPPSVFIKNLIRTIGYEEYLKEATENSDERLENVRELVAVATRFDELGPAEGMKQFIENAALMAHEDDTISPRRALTLMTLHAAKGLEFPIVFLAGCEEGILPHSRSLTNLLDLEEERRLCYVGITRAKERVFLTRARRRASYGAIQANLPSRFLSEIPEHLIEKIGEEDDEGIIDVDD